ncbi:hypothetical protein [Methylobacterium fujisawaense]|uniref:hypothetical protein n=1 Tax=Methylobacterium fujisawaense TaxID=107400 RepID=UPI00313B59CB
MSANPQDDLRAAYDAGFEASGEGWNGEYPAGVMEEAGYKMGRAQWIAHFILDAPVASAPAPSDPAGAGGDLGELERLSKAATQGEWKASGQRMGGDWIISTSERVVANCRPWSMRCDDDRNYADAAFIVAAVAYVRDLIASGQDSAATVEISDEAIQAALKTYHKTHDTANVDDEPEDLDHAAMEAALYEAEKVRSGHLVASTPGQKGAGEAIKFAVGIDDHYDRLEFLQSWLSGDTSEWPEFIQTPPSPPSATPEGHPPMTVEEAREILAYERSRYNGTAKNAAAYLRWRADLVSDDQDARGVLLRRADAVELALRTLHAAGEVR